ncbi:tetraacyldisaccharide 4'-kinase [Chitinimonas sp.]|uniref:tetraacyldisaccharide 4'-kinase n=1 Tax=Chitinimonas sp. TaxID=1934313 RepID=UPI002F9507AB
MQTPAYWQTRFPACLLLPLSALFSALAALRRGLYALGVLRQRRLPVSVVVIGNITAGGAGKTPTVLYLAEQLRRHGRKPGILSRGYGGSETGPAEVPTDGTASRYGDEPALLARRSGCPVFIGRDRHATGLALLARHPDVDVLLCDDGLQHYRLARDVEIVVVDGSRGLQNGWLLPAGPLRETAGRLARCDALLVNGAAQVPIPPHPRRFDMRLQPAAAWRLKDPAERRPLADFAGQPLAALAGIGHPARFFATLAAAGLQPSQHSFPDHHHYTATDLQAIQGGALLVTEKDAVKLTALLSAGELPHGGNIWAVPVEAQIAPDLADWLIDRLHTAKSKDGRKTA